MTIRRTLLGTALCASLLAGTAQAQTAYTLTDLGQVDGLGSFAVGINESGQIAGWIVTSNHKSRAVMSVDSQPFAYVPALQTQEVSPEGIGPTGDITGNIVVSAFPNFAYHAFRYSPGTGLIDLGTLGGTSSTGIGVNARGQVAGWSYNGSNILRAFRSTPGQPMQALPLLGTSTSQSFASGINDAGQVVGYAENASGVFRAFRYTDGQALLELPTAVAGIESRAHQINGAGQVVGQAGGRAFRYTDGIGMEDIDTLQTGNSVATSINSQGDVVGYFVSQGAHRAFRYTTQDGMIDLNTFVDSASGWVLTGAYGINSLGQIVAQGTHAGDTQPRAVLLTPTTPDRTPPTISAAVASPAALWPANHKLTRVVLSVSASDDRDPTPACAITQITNSEPADAGDQSIVGALEALLRAETTSVAGRVYSLDVTCTDAASNTATTVVVVTVPHDQSAK
jgi:probable HAF family extracellular repeat protein